METGTNDPASDPHADSTGKLSTRDPKSSVLPSAGDLRAEVLVKKLEAYIDWNGADHDEDCPGDDTCECSLKPMNDGINDVHHFLSKLLEPLLASLAQVTQEAQLVADVLAEYADELDKAACDRCEQCGPGVMCSFHSVLSALQRHTWTNGAIERDRLKRELSTLSASLAAAQAENAQLKEDVGDALDGQYAGTTPSIARAVQQQRVALDNAQAEITRLQGYVQHVHTRQCYDDPGPAHGKPSLICGLDPAPLPKERELPCRNGHTWSNDYGDDWTPEVGMLCDCHGKQWGLPLPKEPTTP